MNRQLILYRTFSNLVEIVTLTRDGNKSRIKILPHDEVQEYITAFEKETEKAEAAKKEAKESKS